MYGYCGVLPSEYDEIQFEVVKDEDGKITAMLIWMMKLEHNIAPQQLEEVIT